MPEHENTDEKPFTSKKKKQEAYGLWLSPECTKIGHKNEVKWNLITRASDSIFCGQCEYNNICTLNGEVESAVDYNFP